MSLTFTEFSANPNFGSRMFKTFVMSLSPRGGSADMQKVTSTQPLVAETFSDYGRIFTYLAAIHPPELGLLVVRPPYLAPMLRTVPSVRGGIHFLQCFLHCKAEGLEAVNIIIAVMI